VRPAAATGRTGVPHAPVTGGSDRRVAAEPPPRPAASTWSPQTARVRRPCDPGGESPRASGRQWEAG